jgi:TFIIF-interacting CTD phosphatase-like protein
MKHAQKHKLRPYLMQFIEWANKHFDLVLWTWEMPAFDEPIISLLEPYLFAKLYRFHCIIVNLI